MFLIKKQLRAWKKDPASLTNSQALTLMKCVEPMLKSYENVGFYAGTCVEYFKLSADDFLRILDEKLKREAEEERRGEVLLKAFDELKKKWTRTRPLTAISPIFSLYSIVRLK